MATIVKRINFENLLAYASLGKDSNGDGIVDGWTAINDPNVDENFFFDVIDLAQGITVSSASGQGFAGIRSEMIPVSPNADYTLSAETKGEGEETLTLGVTGTGPQLQIKWFDSTFTEIGETLGEVQVIDSQYVRISVTGTSPANASFAEARLVFRCEDSSASGTVWFKNAQFQKGNVMTDFEETDFFTIVPVAPTYASGWSIVEVNGDRVVQSEALPAGSTVNSGFQIKYFVPYNADNISAWIEFDTRRISAGEKVELFYNGSLIYTVQGGLANKFFIKLINMGRDNTVLTIRHNRPDDGTANGETATVEYYRIEWEVLSEPPTQIELPDRDVVKYIDFESEEYDPFFTVIDQAPGWRYGFERSFRRRYSGWWSYRVKDTADSGGTDEVGRPPSIPPNQVARALIQFKVPLVAISPILTLRANFHAAVDEIGRIYLNGELIWEATGTEQPFNVWQEVIGYPIAGATNELIIEYRKGSNQGYAGDDTIYIDDIIVAYDLPEAPLYYIGTPTITNLRTTASTKTYSEGFERHYTYYLQTEPGKTNYPIPLGFFSMYNPGILDSGGGKSRLPEAGWNQVNLVGSSTGNWNGKPTTSGKMMKADRKKLKNSEDAAFDIIFSVPFGVENPKLEFWNLVELERAKKAAKGEKYPRLYEEYRIWVNGSLWKEFDYCDPNGTKSVSYKGAWCCPWGTWWKETINLTPGKQYRISFELQRDAGDSSPVHGRDICAVDDLKVTWTEKKGQLEVIPGQIIFRLDGTHGITALKGRNGAIMPPFEHVEYEAYGQAGAVYQHSKIKARILEQPIMITGSTPEEARDRMRSLVSFIGNREFSLGVAYPDGEHRTLNCRYYSGLEGQETSSLETFKMGFLNVRAFDPFWYSEPITLTGEMSYIISNTGDYDIHPVIRVYGAADSGFKVELREFGGQAVSSFTINYPLVSGQFIIADTRPGKKTVIRDSNDSWYQYLSGDLFSIPQGVWEVALVASGTDSNTKLEIDYRIPYYSV